MSFYQTRDILEHARKFHRCLSEFYEKLKEATEKERTRVLLDYMSRHERYLDESLALFEEEVSSVVLDTYFKYGSEASPISEIRSFQVKEHMGVDDILAVAMHFDACLVEFYKEMAGQSVSQHVREVFENLLKMEQGEKMELSKQALGLRSL